MSLDNALLILGRFRERVSADDDGLMTIGN